MKRPVLLLTAFACVVLVGVALVFLRPNQKFADLWLVGAELDHTIFCVTNCSDVNVHFELSGIDIRYGGEWIWTNYTFSGGSAGSQSDSSRWKAKSVGPHGVWYPVIVGPTNNVAWRLRVGASREAVGVGKLLVWIRVRRMLRRLGPPTMPMKPLSIQSLPSAPYSATYYDRHVELVSEQAN